MGLTGLLVDLDGGLVAIDPDNLADESIVADTDLQTVNERGKRKKNPRISQKRARTSSYMAQPIIFSATTTGLARQRQNQRARSSINTTIPGDGEDGTWQLISTSAVSFGSGGDCVVP